jgi:hypothetical protein
MGKVCVSGYREGCTIFGNKIPPMGVEGVSIFIE